MAELTSKEQVEEIYKILKRQERNKNISLVVKWIFFVIIFYIWFTIATDQTSGIYKTYKSVMSVAVKSMFGPIMEEVKQSMSSELNWEVQNQMKNITLPQNINNLKTN